MQCDACPEPAAIDMPYRGAHLCTSHFTRSVWDRVRREWRRQVPAFPGGTIAVALSGGKDSAVALTLTQRYFGRRAGVRIVAVSVDEGIEGYRAATLATAQELTRQLGVEHRIVRTDTDGGMTTDAAASRLSTGAPCSFCGVWRRQSLNRVARDVGAELLVLGFNLDDLAQTVLMNLARADVDRLQRMAPHREKQPGLVPRVAPLAMVPEREVYLFARLEGIPFDHGECPHAGRAARNIYRETIWRLEAAVPGTRQALLRTRETLLPLLAARPPTSAPQACRVCGEPASGAVCRACTFRELARTAFLTHPEPPLPEVV
ncbi:MAG: TIGR00269 family protein [Thermoplasmata archaeon]|nr:TIGR00269 family protein [Thermoplasmata archaeon]